MPFEYKFWFHGLRQWLKSNEGQKLGRVQASKNTGSLVGPRAKLNFIEGDNITLTVADSSSNDRIDVTVASAGGGSGLTQQQTMAVQSLRI